MTMRMVHPDLPPTQFIEAEPLAVPHYRASGWVEAPPAPEVPATAAGTSDAMPGSAAAPEPAVASASADATPAADPDAIKPRRAAKTKESDQ